MHSLTYLIKSLLLQIYIYFFKTAIRYDHITYYKYINSTDYSIKK